MGALHATVAEQQKEQRRPPDREVASMRAEMSVHLVSMTM